MPRHLFFAKDPGLLLADDPEVETGDAGSGAVATIKLPEWVHIMPAPDKDGLIHSRDNRILHVKDLEKLARDSNKAIKRQKGGGPVDADHRIYGWPGGGEALGWAEEYEARPSGLFARVEWLDEGKHLIGNRLYRYTSSVVDGEMEPEVDEEAWSITWHITPAVVEGFAITNIPALTTQAMFTKIPLGLAAQQRDDAVQVLLRKMGLSAGASPGEIRDAWSAIGKKLGTSGGIPDDLAAARAAHAEAVAELTAANDRITQLQADQAGARVEQLVHSGRITPAMRAGALKIAKGPGGLAALEEMYANAPRIVPAEAESHQPAPKTAVPHGVDPLAFELAKQGLSTAEIIARLKQRRPT